MFITARRLSLGAVAAFYFPFLVACQDDTTPTPASGGLLASGGSPTNTAGSTVTGGAGTSAGTSSAGAATGGAAGGAGASGGGAGSASGGSAGGGGTSAGGPSGGAGGASGGVGGASGGAGGAGGTAGAACGTITKANDGSYTRTGWKAVYACTGGACPAKNADDTGDIDTNAFDSDYQSRWSTGVYQAALKNQGRFPLTFTVDMQMAASISKLTTHPGCKDIFDSPGTIEVQVSTNGTDFTTVTPSPHTPAVPANEACPPNASSVATDTITFPTTCARYVRLIATQRTTSDRYWAIGDMKIYP
jgi:hypothetical protein